MGKSILKNKIKGMFCKKKIEKSDLPVVLLVDDEEVNRKIIKEGLKDQYTIIEADNGINALEILSGNQNIKAVITDLQMPEMNGIELIKQIRKREAYKTLPIIANTQYGETKQEGLLYEIGVNEFVYKPTAPHIVAFKLRNALRDL